MSDIEQETEQDVDTYNYWATRLNLDYVRAVGEELRARLFPQPTRVRNATGDLVDGPVPFPLPVAISYQPGDGTNYALIFVPLRAIRQISQLVNDEGAAWHVPSGSYDSQGNVKNPNEVLVLKCNGTPSDWSLVIDLGIERKDRIAPHYVGEKVRDNLATASAITALLRAAAGQSMLDPR